MGWPRTDLREISNYFESLQRESGFASPYFAKIQFRSTAVPEARIITQVLQSLVSNLTFTEFDN